MPKYLYNVLIAIDQLFNALLFGLPDETLSGEMGRLIQDGRCKLCRPICHILDWVFWEKDHCVNSIDKDENYKRN